MRRGTSIAPPGDAVGHVHMSRIARFVLLLLALFAIRPAFAAELTLAWDPPADAVTTGYVIFVGTAPGLYFRQVRIGKVTSHTVDGLTPGGTYYFVVRAYDASGRLSGPSNEVAGTVAPVSVGHACLTPDPFVILGGGHCFSGHWLPPDMELPGAPAPVAPPATTPPAQGWGGCATPDPFVALGGGTCRDGGWLPPGMTIGAAGRTVPSPAPPALAPADPPMAAPPLADGTCVTDDPFRGIPGLVGVCRAGGWTPWPGVTVPATVQPADGTDYIILAADNGDVFAILRGDRSFDASLAAGTRVVVRALYEPAPDGLPAGVRLLRIVELRVE